LHPLHAHECFSFKADHGNRSDLWCMVITNQWCFCRTVFASLECTYHPMIASVKYNRCFFDKTRTSVNLNEPECLMCPLSPLGLKDDCQHAWVHKPLRTQPVSVLIPPITPAPPSRPSSRGSKAPRGFLGTLGDDWELLERSGTSTLIGQRIWTASGHVAP
jgi:hypothetical protein